MIVAVRGDAPIAPAYVDVQPPIEDSLPDWKKSSSASSSTPGCRAAFTEASSEKPSSPDGGGKQSSRYATAQTAASAVVAISSCGMLKATASSGTTSAPKPKNMPTTLSIAP